VNSAALAIPADLPVLRTLLHACAERLADQGYRNWRDFDVTESLEADLLQREVWLLREPAPFGVDEPIIATWTVGTVPLRPYPAGFWPEDGTRAMYLNRLAVVPDCQGRGTGARCMAIAAARARQLGCDAIRLDYLAANDGLRRFYTRLGYEPVGEVTRGGLVFIACERTLALGH
jgi:GNAT superfamily N-acetyltransferase